MSDTKKKILVGMSGGVDSSAAALILRDQGHEVAGLTFELWDSEDGSCGTKNDVRDAAEVCRVLGIPHYVVDFRAEFRQQVMERFVRDYRNGLTPNPCVDCNRTIKFAAFAEKAKELGYRILIFNAVVKGNDRAIQLYTKLGFQRVGVIPGGYLLKNGVYQDIYVYYHVL